MQEIPDLILLNAGYASHYGDWNYKNVSSPFARIYLVKEGKAKLHLPDTTQVLTSGHLYLIPPFTLHSYECDEYYTLYYMHIYENELSSQRMLEDYVYPVEADAVCTDSQLVERLVQINPGRELNQYDPALYDNTRTLMQSINIHSLNPSYTILETRGILFQLLSRFVRHSTHKYETTDNRIQKVLRYIQKNTDKKITMNEMIDICCLSKDHFIRLFKKEMKVTPVQYINRKKIEKAQLMLITGKQSVKNIAYALSFENVYYFNRLFKKITGVTPGEYIFSS